MMRTLWLLVLLVGATFAQDSNAPPGFGDIGDKIKGAASQIAGSVSGELENAKNTAANIGQEINQFVNNGVEEVKKGFETVKDKAQDVIGSVKNGAQNAFGTAKDKAQDGLNAVKGGVENAVGTVKNEAQNIESKVNQPRSKRYILLGNSTQDSLSNFANQIKSNVLQFQPLKDGTISSNGVQTLPTSDTQSGSQIFPALSNIADQIKTNIASDAQNLKDTFQNSLQSSLQNLKPSLQNFTDNLKEKVQNFSNDVKNQIQDFKDDAQNATNSSEASAQEFIAQHQSDIDNGVAKVKELFSSADVNNTINGLLILLFNYASSIATPENGMAPIPIATPRIGVVNIMPIGIISKANDTNEDSGGNSTSGDFVASDPIYFPNYYQPGETAEACKFETPEEQFQRVDANDTKEVDFEGYNRMVDNCGRAWRKVEFDRLDTNHDGKLSWDEWVAEQNRIKEEQERAELQWRNQSFHLADFDGDGFLNLKEFKQYLENRYLNDSDAQDYLQSLEEGKMNFDQFVDFEKTTPNSTFPVKTYSYEPYVWTFDNDVNPLVRPAVGIASDDSEMKPQVEHPVKIAADPPVAPPSTADSSSKKTDNNVHASPPFMPVAGK
ncbi:hypothetical protein FO519_009630, partial [Halicephalobus sp. NKZ332]